MCAYKSKVLARADGGTGLSVAGTSGNVLTSDGTNWTSAAQTGSGLGYTFQMMNNITNPLDLTTYYLRFGLTMSTSQGQSQGIFYIPQAGTITQVYGITSVIGTLGSSENSTVAIRLNNTTDTNITTSLQLTSTTNAFSNNSLGISVSAGDFIEVKMITPTWTTNPTGISTTLTIYIS